MLRASGLLAGLVLGMSGLRAQLAITPPTSSGPAPPRAAPPPRPPAEPAKPEKLTPLAQEAMYRDAVNAFNAGNYDRCAGLCQQIISRAAPGSEPMLDRVHFTLAAALLRKGDNPAAIPALRQYLEAYSSQADEARLALAQALLAVHQTEAALTEIRKLLDDAPGLDDQSATLTLALAAADTLLQAGQAAQTLEFLQSLPTGEQLLQRQRQRVTDLTEAYNAPANVLIREPLAAKLSSAKAALTRMQNEETLELPRYLRLGGVFLKLDRPWEAVVVYRDLLQRFPAASDQVFAVQGLALAWQDAGRAEEAMLLCRRFLAEFRTHPLAPEMTEIGGRLALRLGRNADALAFYTFAADAARKKSKSALLSRSLLALADLKFATGDQGGARADCESYLRDFPAGEEREKMSYLAALTFMAAHDYDRAEPAIKGFLGKFPQSSQRADATYRLAVCRFARQENSGALAACDQWLREYPKDTLVRPAVISLKGDVLKALNRPDDAFAAYRLAATQPGVSDEVLAYALAECARQLGQKRDWDGLTELYSPLLAAAPNSPLAAGWVTQIATADLRAGRLDTAWNFVVGRLTPVLDDPTKSGAEEMLALLAQIQARRMRVLASAPPPDTPAANEAKQDPPVTAAALAGQLYADQGKITPLARARLAYFEAKYLQAITRPADAEKILAKIGLTETPDQLSAPLLAETGEALLRQSSPAAAKACFETLLARYPASDWRDCAYVGLGDLALAHDEGQTAETNYLAAIDRAGAQHRLREATVGQARAFLLLGRLTEAEKLFTSIAAAREWRGESTALSLYYLGQIAVRRGDLPKGVAFFQRVYVGQQRFPDWAARAYLDSGLALEKLGQPAAAIATYREMLGNEHLRIHPAASTARERLRLLESSAT